MYTDIGKTGLCFCVSLREHLPSPLDKATGAFDSFGSTFRRMDRKVVFQSKGYAV